jgi:hypothetical protein
MSSLFRKRGTRGHGLERLAAHLKEPGTAAIVATAEHSKVARAVGGKRLRLFDCNDRVYFK